MRFLERIFIVNLVLFCIVIQGSIGGTCTPTKTDYQTNARKKVSDTTWVYCNTKKKKTDLEEKSCATGDIVFISGSMSACQSKPTIGEAHWAPYTGITSIKICSSIKGFRRLTEVCKSYGDCFTREPYKLYFNFVSGSNIQVDKSTWCRISIPDEKCLKSGGTMSNNTCKCPARRYEDGACEEVNSPTNETDTPPASDANGSGQSGSQTTGTCNWTTSETVCSATACLTNVNKKLFCNTDNANTCNTGDIVKNGIGASTETFKKCTQNGWVSITQDDVTVNCAAQQQGEEHVSSETSTIYYKTTNSAKITNLRYCNAPANSQTNTGALTCDDIGKAEKDAPTQRNTNYHICEVNGCQQKRDCHSRDMLTPHTSDGQCVAAGRQGYKICTATACDNGYEPYQGFCKKKTQSAPSEESSQSGSADTIVMEGYCLNAEGDAGIDDIATNTYCWCSSHMTNAPRCRLSHMFLSEQTGVCTKSNNATTRKAACDSFCQGKAQTMLQICECEEAKERGEKPADTVCYDDGTPDIFTPESASDNCAQSGGVLDANGECVCEGENLEQSDDKQTCVATQTNEPGADTPPEEPCGGGTLNADGTCNCDVDGANLTQSGDTCDCIDGYHRDTNTNKCIEGEAPTDVNSPTATDPTSADSQRATTATPAKDPLKEAEDAYKKAKDNEQSLANRTLTAGTTLATGLGMMTAASAYSEKKADEDAEQDMKAYLATFKCEYGRGQSVPSSAEEITLPGGNELVEYYQEYKSLADNLKNTKKALGLRAGIENEVVYDKAESNLYKYSSVGKNGGAFTSLSRALTDTEGEDAAAWNTQKEESAKKLKTGAVAAGGGVVGGIGGDALMNTDMIQNIASKFKGSDTESE